jgi:PAS domain-containing protein
MSTDRRSPDSDATVLINADGTYADASGAALELLGVTIEELRAAGRGAFAVEPVSPEASAAIESAWNRSGAQDAVGHATVKRPDRATVRVRYLLTSQPDGRYLIAIQPIGESASQPSTLYTIGAGPLCVARGREAPRGGSAGQRRVDPHAGGGGRIPGGIPAPLR